MRYADPVLDVCLDPGDCHVGIANELTASRQVPERDVLARARGIAAPEPGSGRSARQVGECQGLRRVTNCEMTMTTKGSRHENN
ncbi:MAG TPA: hypothetical protein VFI65_31895 [Streptosporangiaceae bacterium]|nr:hypothetical protein [Streptosporangiaceae bacterium]